MCTCRVVVYCKIHAHCGGERGRCLASHHCESIKLYLMFYHSLETLSLPYLIIIYRVSYYHKILLQIFFCKSFHTISTLSYKQSNCRRYFQCFIQLCLFFIHCAYTVLSTFLPNNKIFAFESLIKRICFIMQFSHA